MMAGRRGSSGSRLMSVSRRGRRWRMDLVLIRGVGYRMCPMSAIGIDEARHPLQPVGTFKAEAALAAALRHEVALRFTRRR